MTRIDRPIRTILVIRRKGLGDALVALPAVRELAAAFPNARLDLVIDRPFAPLLQDLAQDLRVIAWSPDQSGFGWLRRLRAARYDLVLDYLGSPRTAAWTALSGAPLRVGYDHSLRRWAYNVRVPRNKLGDRKLVQFAGEAFLDPLRALGLAPPAWRPDGARPHDPALGSRYETWAADWQSGDRPRAALVFSATWPAKAWPAAQGAALYRQLWDLGLDPVLVTGPGDDRLEAELRAALPHARLAPPTTLPELAHLLAGCAVFVGTDNGARHLATVLGVPTVTVFGPTDPRGWNPEDPRHVAVSRNEPCAPCNRTHCPVAGHPCLDQLPADQVAAEVTALLRRVGVGHPGDAKETT